MSRDVKIRRVAATALLASYTAWCLWLFAWAVSGGPREWARRTHTWIAYDWVPQLQYGFLLALALAATLGLARRWWWARMLGTSLAISVLFPAVQSSLEWGARFDSLVQMAWAGAVLASLRGRAFLSLYEGQRAAGVDWSARGMWAVWWAIVLNGATLVEVSTLLIGAWQEASGCFGRLAWIDHYPPAYWPAVALAGLLLVGLMLLARQRTAGLLLTAVVSVAFPVVLLLYLRSVPHQQPASIVVPAVPGLLAAWLSIGFWVKPMFRLLRRDVS
jgi:hypothetical protein